MIFLDDVNDSDPLDFPEQLLKGTFETIVIGILVFFILLYLFRFLKKGL